MKRATHERISPNRPSCTIILAALGLCLPLGLAQADQVEMQNGDRYVGKVLSLDADSLVLQNEFLGTVPLPRGKVASITLRPNAGANSVRLPALTNSVAHAPALGLTNDSAGFSASLRQLGTNTSLIRQVQTQFLSDAGPEANQKYNELLGGLMSGKLTVNDLRVEAKTAADQIRAVRKDLGDDAGGVLDGYLAILDNFVKETGSAPATPVKTPVPVPKAKAQPGAEED